MKKKTIVFFSTNAIWGGSEILWTQTAKKLHNENYCIKSVTKYYFEYLKQFIMLESDSFVFSGNEFLPPVWKRILNKTGISKYNPNEKIENFLADSKPSLAIISQGNNIEGYDFMQLCLRNKIPFVTITHLVVVSKWPAITDDKIEKFRIAYNAAEANFFVSAYTLKMHETFLGYKTRNAKIVYNPFTKSTGTDIQYPALLNGDYNVALLGRLENYHKGYDLLIEVLSLDKWKRRNIQFTIYGSGPHLQLIKRLVAINEISNLTVNEFIDDISQVWSGHHLLMMPSRLEGQSLTLIEAMNFKRATVATRVGGVEELIEEGKSGFIADYPSATSIDAALERAWDNREEWEQLGINAYQAIKKIHPADAVSYFIEQLEPFL